jgi:small subunit ribosomal protein S6
MLFDPALGEEKIKNQISKTEEKLKSFGGEIEKTDLWGNKKLSSMIQKAPKMTSAFYVCIFFKSEPSVPGKLKEMLKVNESVIRYFLSLSDGVPQPKEEEKPVARPTVEAVDVGEIKGAPLGQSQ